RTTSFGICTSSVAVPTTKKADNNTSKVKQNNALPPTLFLFMTKSLGNGGTFSKVRMCLNLKL
ncbi:MAG: hypothetical protein NWE90_00095, partial [Candidatus Bathyarchaeota archaeon]|nr:hypothetical protein [Candidatus Bathyarchaeota archaeon]